MSEEGIVEIHGKDYQTVALRLKTMRQDHADWGVSTEVLARAESVMVKAQILDRDGRVMGSGHAEEKRDAGQINKTAALENCETSAIGRALAAAGYLGVDIRTADEMEEARAESIAQFMIRYCALLREHWDAIHEYKVQCREGHKQQARRRLESLVGKEDMRILWRAPARGSVFTTAEHMKDGDGREKEFRGEDVDNPDYASHPKM